MLKYAILGFLGYGPMTGYDIKQRMDRSTTHFWHAKLSQIYTTLTSLEQGGFVTSSIKEQSAKPDKRLYLLTEKGQADFITWLNEPYTEYSPKKETLVLKMFFPVKMERTAALTQLQIQLDVHKKQLAYYQTDVIRDLQMAKNEFPMLTRDAEMWESTRLFGERYEEIYIQWIEDMIGKISSSNGKNE